MPIFLVLLALVAIPMFVRNPEPHAPPEPFIPLDEVMLRHQMKVNQEPMQFDLPAMRLYAAIYKVTVPAHVNWYVTATIFDGVPLTRPLKGTYIWSDALDELFRGSGCEWQPAIRRYIDIKCRLPAEPQR